MGIKPFIRKTNNPKKRVNDNLKDNYFEEGLVILYDKVNIA
jgi:hypothetical protein